MSAAGLVGAVKGVPYLVKGVKGQGLAGVFQIKAGLKAHFFDSDSDFSAERRVFDGVGSKIGDDLPYAGLVCRNQRITENVIRYRQVLGLQRQCQPVKGGLGQCLQRDFISGQLDLSGLQPGEIQHFQHHAVHPLDFRQNDLQILFPLFFVDALL